MPSDLLSVQEALARILREFSTLSEELIPLEISRNRILSRAILADIDLPPFTNSSMDGFAVRSEDILQAAQNQPVTLTLVGDIPAGTIPTFTLDNGQAARIMTGAVLPKGADAVVPVERTDLYPAEREDSIPRQVNIFLPAVAGDFIRPQGQDVKAGTVVLKGGRRITPQDIGLLATLGIVKVPVYRRPRIALLSTGDELIDPAQPLAPGKIRNSNSYTLAAMVEQNGGEVLSLGTAPDDPQVIQERLQRAVHESVDLILTSAGVSVGAYDYVKDIIQANGHITFWKVDMRPGKPLAFGDYQGIRVIGLPGNPVSSFVGFLIFVAPVLRKMSGLPPVRQRLVKAHLKNAVESDGRESYLRANLYFEDGKRMAELSGHQGSGNLLALTQANALLIIPSGVKSLPDESEVDALLLNDEIE